MDIVRSPRQAATIFGLDGARPPRQKNLFIVKFVKNGDTSGSFTSGASGTWNKDLGFMVKSVDRPSVEPKVEELNQYNKKRLVHTGYKIGQTRLTLYDTADSMAMRMWTEYSQYYFGDFRHSAQAQTDWQFDTVTQQYQDTAGGGFGFAPQSSTNSALNTTGDFTVPYFFSTISVYQVFGGNFVQFDLINPKITSFDPDELDYSNSDIATITMGVSAESIQYVNGFQPKDINSDSFLQQAFGNPEWFYGDTVEIPSSDISATTYPAAFTPPPSQYSYSNQISTPAYTLSSYPTSYAAGALSSFGAYDFGSTAAITPAALKPLSTDLAFAASTNSALASVLGIADPTVYPDASVKQLIKPYAPPSYISQAIFDEASSAVEAISGQGQGDPGIAQAVTYGIISAALANGVAPRDQMYNQNPGNAAGPNSWSSTTAQGLALSRESYGIVNAQRPPSSQIGFNYRSAANAARTAPRGGATVGDQNVDHPAMSPSNSVSNVKSPSTPSPLD